MFRISFVEPPTSNLSSTRSFYADAFGLAFTNFSPSYSCTLTGDVDLGLQADASEVTSAPLAVITVVDLEASLDAVAKAGGIITKPYSPFRGVAAFTSATRAATRSRPLRRTDGFSAA